MITTFGAVLAFLVAHNGAHQLQGDAQPVSKHLTSACQYKTVKAQNANYVYSTVEHCKRSS